MSKRISHLERAILDLEDQIAALELARNALIRLRPTAPKAKVKWDKYKHAIVPEAS